MIQPGSDGASNTPPAKDFYEDEMIVYSQEIDDVIHRYFRTLKSNPEIDEEEKRLVDDIFPEAEDGQTGRRGSSTPSKKASKKPIVSHVVRKGESLWRIANQYGVPLYTILSANPKKAQQIIHPGERLRIPTRKGIFYKVKRGDNLSKISRRYKISVKSIQKENKINAHRIRPGDQIFLPGAQPLPPVRYKYKNRFIWPVKGRITSRYGWRRHPLSRNRHFHQGIDIGAKQGTRIRAAAKGVVIHSGKSGGYGRLIILRHNQGYLSAYAHCSKIYVKKGTVVKQGQMIARVGASGLATGSHLHFEIKRYQKNLNPVLALRKKIKIPSG